MRRLLTFTLLLVFAMPHSERLAAFLHSVEHKTGKKVYVLQVQDDAGLSHGGVGSLGIYALMRPGASDEEVAHEVLHGELNLEGFVATRAANPYAATMPLAGLLSANLQDFVIHPILDRRARSAGFPQNHVAISHATEFRQQLLSIAGTVNEADRLMVAANAMGIAEVLQRGYDPSHDLQTLSSEKLPKALALSEKLLEQFPPLLAITPEQSFARAKSILAFLDHETTKLAGNPPSQFLRIVNPLIEPPLDAQRERVIRQAFLGDK